uniref:Uncharacterized protein n=1 Tax=Aegilops tauschii subsp. strangulata TaxID=200361 RepID=A0A453MU13_AEGTS
ENPDGQAGADAGLPPPPPPPLDAAGAGLGSDPAEVLPPPPPHLPGGAPHEVAAQGADGSAYPAEHASLNGTSGDAAGYQATENGAAADEMAEPMVPEQSYEDGNAAGAEAFSIWFRCLPAILLMLMCLLPALPQLWLQQKRLGYGMLSPRTAWTLMLGPRLLRRRRGSLRATY